MDKNNSDICSSYYSERIYLLNQSHYKIEAVHITYNISVLSFCNTILIS